MAKRPAKDLAPRNPSVAPSGRRERPDVVHTSIYVPKAVYHVLREIAFKEDRKIHDLIMEGVDAVLTKRRYASIEKLKAGQSR
jgi:hypothetical protein